MRKVFAFLASPLPIAVGGPLIARVSSAHRDSLGILLLEACTTYVYGLLFASVFAVPLFILMRRFGWVTAYTAAGAGLLIGLLGGVIVLNGNLGPERLMKLAEMAVLGATGGAVFWLVARGGIRSNSSLERPQ